MVRGCGTLAMAILQLAGCGNDDSLATAACKVVGVEQHSSHQGDHEGQAAA